MKEAFLILLVVCVLAALTALRYRKQISGIIGIARMFKEAKATLGQRSQSFPRQSEKTMPLVNCSRCSVWVPQNKARKVGDIFYCSDECVKTQNPVRS